MNFTQRQHQILSACNDIWRTTNISTEEFDALPYEQRMRLKNAFGVVIANNSLTHQTSLSPDSPNYQRGIRLAQEDLQRLLTEYENLNS